MPRSITVTLLISCSLLSVSWAQEIQNGGFETGLEGWVVEGEAAGDIGLTKRARSGERALEITGPSGFIQQRIPLEPSSHYQMELSAKGAPVVGMKVGDTIFFERPEASRRWQDVALSFVTGTEQFGFLFMRYGGRATSYDDVRLTRTGPAGQQKLSTRIITSEEGGTGLSPDLPPSSNFKLLGWNLSVPTDTDGNGRSDTISERRLAGGYEDPRFFYTAEDGGMVFRTPVAGYRTSQNTNYTRSELREMLRRGNTEISTRNRDGSPNRNNWVFSSAPQSAQDAAGAVDGTLEATLAINHVTTTGDQREVGRVVIGQIHAKDDEPIRLYYRKLPDHKRGSIYAAHEPLGEEDVFFDLLGSRSSDTVDPAGGIALDEKFSYRIKAEGYFLHVTISKDGRTLAERTIDMSDSGYDRADDYMYFKAGVYNQDKTAEPDDYVMATFYRLSAKH